MFPPVILSAVPSLTEIALANLVVVLLPVDAVALTVPLIMFTLPPSL